MSGSDEVTHLPPKLQKFFKVVLGMEWPETSGPGVSAIGAAWGAFADKADAFADEMEAAAGRLDTAMDGAVASHTVSWLKDDLVTGMRELANQSRDFAKTGKNAGADVTKTKILFVVMAAMALATVIMLINSLVGAFLVPAVEAAAQLSMRLLLRELLTRISQLTIRDLTVAAGEALAKIQRHAIPVAINTTKTAAKYAAVGAGIMAFMDASIDLGQMGDKTRDGFDWDAFTGAVIGGAIGGAAAGVAQSASRGLVGLISKEAKSKLPPYVVALGHLGNAGLQMTMVALTNPLVNLATHGKGNVWDGILGAASRFEPGRAAKTGTGGDPGSTADQPGAGISDVADLKFEKKGGLKVPDVESIDDIEGSGLPAYSAGPAEGHQVLGSDDAPPAFEPSDGRPAYTEDGKPLGTVFTNSGAGGRGTIQTTSADHGLESSASPTSSARSTVIGDAPTSSPGVGSSLAGAGEGSGQSSQGQSAAGGVPAVQSQAGVGGSGEGVPVGVGDAPTSSPGVGSSLAGAGEGSGQSSQGQSAAGGVPAVQSQAGVGGSGEGVPVGVGDAPTSSPGVGSSLAGAGEGSGQSSQGQSAAGGVPAVQSQAGVGGSGEGVPVGVGDAPTSSPGVGSSLAGAGEGSGQSSQGQSAAGGVPAVQSQAGAGGSGEGAPVGAGASSSPAVAGSGVGQPAAGGTPPTQTQPAVADPAPAPGRGRLLRAALRRRGSLRLAPVRGSRPRPVLSLRRLRALRPSDRAAGNPAPRPHRRSRLPRNHR
ncbi:hypothetical protein AB5J62_24525 [Amycolatopsis sp. cg5]|uniref:WXG100-like domain-containing protein n=1 Tax=Amycolatopsis sp. cg5 TaxID=3238802 RepID=UPI0035253926